MQSSQSIDTPGINILWPGRSVDVWDLGSVCDYLPKKKKIAGHDFFFFFFFLEIVAGGRLLFIYFFLVETLTGGLSCPLCPFRQAPYL